MLETLTPAERLAFVQQRRVVDAFFATSRDGDFDALLEVFAPEVQLRIEGGTLRAGASLVLHGAADVAAHTATYSSIFPSGRPALVNGADALLDPERLARLDLDLGPDPSGRAAFDPEEDRR